MVHLLRQPSHVVLVDHLLVPLPGELTGMDASRPVLEVSGQEDPQTSASQRWQVRENLDAEPHG